MDRENPEMAMAWMNAEGFLPTPELRAKAAELIRIWDEAWSEAEPQTKNLMNVMGAQMRFVIARIDYQAEVLRTALGR